MSSPLFFAVLQRQRRQFQGWTLPCGPNVPFEPTPIVLTSTALSNDYMPAKLCQDLVRRGYVLEQLTHNTHVLLLYYRENISTRYATHSRVVPAAFLLGRIEKSTFVVDIVCSAPKEPPLRTQHSGMHLLKAVVHVARSAGCQEITLAALPHVLGYYPKFGYAHRRSCNGSPYVPPRPMPKVLGDAPLDAYYKDPEWTAYLTDLHKAGFAHRHSNDCSNTVPISPSRFLKGRCADDGYDMRVCVSPLLSNKKDSQGPPKWLREWLLQVHAPSTKKRRASPHQPTLFIEDVLKSKVPKRSRSSKNKIAS